MELSHPPRRQIELAIGNPRQLFEHLDASRQRHLDESVERFIVHHAHERSSEYSLLVEVADGSLASEDAAALSQDIRAHFAHRTDEEQQKVQALARAGVRDLAIGVVFLFICAAIALIANRVLPRALGLFVEQGLLILGWVALWRPVDLFLYELRPLRLHRDVLSALSRMNVRMQSTNKPRQQVVSA